jgi:lipoprotein-anchoring transpeptidase ErfK/SrfK
MSSLLRTLSLIYVMGALLFSAAIVLDRNPPLDRASRHAVAVALDAIRSHVVEPAFAAAEEGTRRVASIFTSDLQKPVTPKITAKAAPKPAALPRVTLPKPAPVIPKQPDLATPPPAAEPAAPQLDIAEEAAPPQKAPLAILPPASSAGPSPAELVRVAQRLKQSLSREMLENFALFLYVSKAEKGPWSQRMYVFAKDGSGNLNMLYNWAASTGREIDEIAPDGTRQPSYTPQGYYQLDPNRMYKTHFSGQWHQPMPYAMFFNWENKGLQTGLAIHGASGTQEIALLGSRASAGCIRIAPENAAMLYRLIRTQYQGLAPRFAYDRRTATMSNQGVLMHDAAGNLKMADGYKVLVFVENFGGNDVVAALY